MDRLPIETGSAGGRYLPGLIEYVNVPRAIGMVVSKRLATLHELDTVYSVRDMWTLIEIAIVDGHNDGVANKSS